MKIKNISQGSKKPIDRVTDAVEKTGKDDNSLFLKFNYLFLKNE